MVKIDGKTNTGTELIKIFYYSVCQVYLCCYAVFTLSLGRIWNFFHKLSSSSNFAYSYTVKPRPSADYIGMKMSVLNPLN